MHKKLICLGLITISLTAFSTLFFIDSVAAETSIERLVKKIVRGASSNNEKMYLIEEWVNKNIHYRSDKKQFNMSERWTLPTETLQRKKGDCEDGSILLIAMAVTAGVSTERLKLYAPIEIPDGWHACVAYQREYDDEWVWMEWAFENGRYYDDIENRRTLSEISAYIPMGTYFVVTSLNPFSMLMKED
jgi:hypothetical protein